MGYTQRIFYSLPAGSDPSQSKSRFWLDSWKSHLVIKVLIKETTSKPLWQGRHLQRAKARFWLDSWKWHLAIKVLIKETTSKPLLQGRHLQRARPLPSLGGVSDEIIPIRVFNCKGNYYDAAWGIICRELFGVACGEPCLVVVVG